LESALSAKDEEISALRARIESLTEKRQALERELSAARDNASKSDMAASLQKRST
jgi:hypothetical protein